MAIDTSILTQMDQDMLKAIGTVDGLTEAMKTAGVASERYERSLKGAANSARTLVEQYGPMRIAFDFFNKGMKEHVKQLKESTRQSNAAKVEMKAFELAQKAVAFRSENLAGKLNMVAQGAQKVGRGINAMTTFLSKNSAQLGNVRDSLLKYNRAVFETSRYSQVFGRSPMFDEATWNRAQRGITLTRIEFAKLQGTMQEMWLGVPPMGQAFEDMLRTVQERFGYTAGAAEDAVRRLTEVQAAIPGIVDQARRLELIEDNLDPDRIAKYSYAVSKLGVSWKSTMAFGLFQMPTTDAQKDLLRFEKAVEMKNQAIVDTNVKMGKNAEMVMIGIEKSMEKVVRSLDKMVNRFSAVPSILIGLKTIGMTSIVGLTSQVHALSASLQGVGVNAVRARGALAGMGQANVAGGVSGGAGGGLMRGLGVVGLAAGAGYMAYRSFSQAEEAKRVAALPGTDPWEAYRGRQQAMGSSRMGAMWTGAGAGALAGLGVGSAVAGIGAVPGAIGGAVIGGIGGYMTAEGPAGEAEQERMVRAIRGLHTARAREGFDKGIEVDAAKLNSEKEVLRVVRSQKTEKQRVLAVDALIKTQAYTREELQEKLGAGIMREYNAHRKILDAAKKKAEANMEGLRQHQAEMKLLENIRNVTQQTAQATAQMSQNAAQTAGSWALAERAAKQAAAAQARNFEATKEQMSSLGRFMEERGQTAMMSAFMKPIGELTDLKGERREMLADALSSLEAAKRTGDRTALDAARKEYKQVLDTLGIDGKRVKLLGQMAETYGDMAINAEKVKLEAEAEAAARVRAASTLDRATAFTRSQLDTLTKQRGLMQAQTELVEATAAGYAVSYEWRKKIYDMTVQQIGAAREQLAEQRQATQADLKSAYAKKEEADTLKKYGLSRQLVSRATRGDQAAVTQYNRRMREALDKETQNRAVLLQVNASMTEGLEREIGLRTKITQLQGEQVKQAMALREGYLDVIVEMSTSADLVSKLIPDAQRGLVSLHEMQRVASGGTFGGALRRGFVSVSPYAESMDVAGAAPQYGAGRFKRPPTGGIVAAHLEQLEKGVEREMTTGPGTFAGQRGFEQSGLLSMVAPKKMSINQQDVDANNAAIFISGSARLQYAGEPIRGQKVPAGVPTVTTGGGAMGKARGGMIPGTPSDRDNLVGMVDGARPIGLASGEFVVNARAARRYQGLLEEINARGGTPSSAGGLAGGGIVDQYLKMDRDTLAWHAHRGNQQALAALAIKIREDDPGLTSEEANRQAKYFAKGTAGKLFAHASAWAAPKLKAGFMFSQGPAAMAATGALDIAFPAKPVSQSYWKYRTSVPEALSAHGAELFSTSFDIDKAPTFVSETAGLKLSGADIREGMRLRAGDSQKYHGWLNAQKSLAKMPDYKIRGAFAAETTRRVFTGSEESALRSKYGIAGEKRTYFPGQEGGWTTFRGSEMTSYRGLAEGGMVDPYGLGLRAGLTISGGMKIGTLNLNGKTIGQDLQGGLGDEWKAALQNASG